MPFSTWSDELFLRQPLLLMHIVDNSHFSFVEDVKRLVEISDEPHCGLHLVMF